MNDTVCTRVSKAEKKPSLTKHTKPAPADTPPGAIETEPPTPEQEKASMIARAMQVVDVVGQAVCGANNMDGNAWRLLNKATLNAESFAEQLKALPAIWTTTRRPSVDLQDSIAMLYGARLVLKGVIDACGSNFECAEEAAALADLAPAIASLEEVYSELKATEETWPHVDDDAAGSRPAAIERLVPSEPSPLFKLNASYVIAAEQATEDLVEDLDMLLSNAQACFDAGHEDLSGVAWSGAHFLRMAASVWTEIRNRVNFDTAGSAA